MGKTLQSAEQLFRGARYRRGEIENAKVISIIPEIPVEVLSPNDILRSIHRKLKQYFEAGVKEVWRIDPDVKEVEIWAGPALPQNALAGEDKLTMALRPGFSLPVADLFN